MSEHYRKAKIVDGYTALKAAQRAGPGKVRPEQAADEPVADSKQPEPRAGTHIGRTVMPTKLELTCYECGYRFSLTGRTPKTYCPKCRGMLNLQDVILEGSVTESVCTAGKLVLQAGARLKGPTLRGGDVVLQGTVESGSIQADRWLEIGPRAVYRLEDLKAQDIRIAAEAEVRFRDAVAYRNVEIRGSLDAYQLSVSGSVTVAAAGCLKGKVVTPSLVVEEGGGLLGEVRVEPGEEKEGP